MPIRTAAPALAGALALAAVAAPGTAFAVTQPVKPQITHAAVSSLNIGLTGKLTFSVNISAKDAKGVKSIQALPYPLASKAVPTRTDVAKEPGSSLPTLARTATTLTVGASDVINVAVDRFPDEIAGTYGVAILVTAKDGSTTFAAKGATYSWTRADVLSAKPASGTVRKGALLTVKGQLNRADWTKRVWAGNGGQLVLLQQRNAKGVWVTKATAKTAANGSVSVSARDYASGSWRLVYGGNTVSGAAVSGATSVVVK
ncbi:hypothetical protein [Streptacidiphilus anmyonensis]|uniref:hypothetical protein n=1 Tax=Streptacidiphilus anmyonensis TaxID=405782 RepID=UPI000694297C|nr:hypothetical protein [Streptacidiphilus anmyonensis]